MPLITRLCSHPPFRRFRKSAVFVAFCAVGLIWITGCGSGSSSSSGGSGSGTPTPNSNGLTIYPATASVPVGAQVDFTGYVPSQPNSTITWAVSGSSAGSITSSGVYTAPSSVPSPAQVSVTATSGGFTATAVATITSAQAVSVSPAAASIPADSQTTFTAAVNGAAATGVTWQVNGTAGGDSVHGTIDSNGNYIAPQSPPPGGSTVITAVVGGNSGNATATIIFSNETLNGNYAFSYAGDDTSGFLGIIGEFAANGAAGTVSGTEDFVDAQGASVGQTLGGTYSIGPDGRGTVDLTSSTGEVWQIALASNQHALLINLNSGATGSGTIDQQTSTTALATGPYVFQLSGLDANGLSVGVAGAFTSFGNGLLAPTGNVMDVNDAGTATSDDTTLTGSFSTTGLAFQSNSFTTLTGGTASFAYFPVSNNHLHLLEIDGNGFMAGDVFIGTTAPSGGYNATLLPAGNSAFTMGGATQSPYAAGGVFISNGCTGGTSTSGSVTGGVFDNNNGGVHFQSDATLQSTTYAVDQNTGRITSSFTTPAGTFAWVGYVTAPVDPSQPDSSELLMLESDSNATASGTAFLQSSKSQPSGAFAFNLAGQANGNTPGEQDVLAQLAISGAALSGTVDFNNFATGATVTGLNVQTGKSTITSPDGNGRGTTTVAAADGASFPLAYYVVNSGQVLFLETDNQRVMLGTMLKQF
ncbi:MAG: beta strand repeat-containing protein [Candidatus Acidiferrales bacterium]